MLFTAALVILLVMRSPAAEKRAPSESTNSQQLEIVNSGIFALTPDAMGITFYIHLFNNLPFSLDVATRMWECCESFDEGEVDCSHIHLIGGYKGVLLSRYSRNVTLFYPNLYVYNRVGECLVGVWYREPSGKVKELRTKIKFDTMLTPRRVAPAIEDYYEAETIRARKCAYLDEDPLDKCRPVDCSRKYNGQRQFYSVVERRCLAAPKCNSTLNNNNSSSNKHNNKGGKMDLPTFVYVPEGNVCEDLEPIIKEEDIRTINSGRGVDQDLHPSNEYDFIVCHHGNKSLFTGHCRCHEGWRSTTNHIRPTTLKVHLCTESQFEPVNTIEDALLELSESFHLIVPRFVAALSKPTFFKIQGIIFGTAILISVFFSVIFTLVYKLDKPGKTKPGKTFTDHVGRIKRIKHVKTIRHKVSAVFAPEPEKKEEALPEEASYDEEEQSQSPAFYSEICNPYIYYHDQQFQFKDSIPRIFNPTQSIGYSTRTIPALQIDRFTNSSMTPQEKFRYFGQFQEQNELTPLLGDEFRPQSNNCTSRSLTKPSGSRITTDNYPRSRKKTISSMIQRSFLSRRNRRKSRSIITRRRKDCSSISKSMAKLTYSSIPSSDSCSSLEESTETASPCTSSEDN